MPEGDTIFRAARTLRAWLAGREITAAEAKVDGFPAHKLVGQTVDEVTAQGKHLLLRMSSGMTVHTHMRMTGSWHVYREGERWQKPAWQARLVLTAGDRIAVCFNAPVIELLAAKGEATHPSLTGLGPDVLVDPFDVDEVIRRARGHSPPATAIGEVLLDQRVVAGIGNIYRNECLFLEGVDPRTRLSRVDDETLRRLVETAATLMRRNAGAGAPVGRDLGAGADRTWVYGRRGRPCYRCRAVIRSARVGVQARTAYWCPNCQPEMGEVHRSD